MLMKCCLTVWSTIWVLSMKEMRTLVGRRRMRRARMRNRNKRLRVKSLNLKARIPNQQERPRKSPNAKTNE